MFEEPFIFRASCLQDSCRAEVPRRGFEGILSPEMLNHSSDPRLQLKSDEHSEGSEKRCTTDGGVSQEKGFRIAVLSALPISRYEELSDAKSGFEANSY